MEDAPNERLNEQIEKAEKLQDLLLEDLIRVAEAKELSSADRVLIYRMLRENGWSLDPSKLPQKAKDLLAKQVAFDEDLDGEPTLRMVK